MENNLSSEDKKKQLFLKQKELLDTFLQSHAITKEQYDTSFNGLIQKMNVPAEWYDNKTTK